MSGHCGKRIQQRGVVDVGHGGPKAGEVERLARRAEGDQATFEALVADRQRAVHRTATPHSGVHEFAPDLVGDHEQIVTVGDLGNGGHFNVVEHTTGRVVRIAEQDHTGGGIDGRLESLG